MSATDMDKKLGYKGRMRKVANNLRKFGMLEGEKAKLRDYHTIMIKDKLKHIEKIGIVKYSNNLGMMCGVSGSTIKSDFSIMKRYGVIPK
jgi:hypothetical protein|tara:strand:- start:1697 stop:1966 length:270 start_codon:yes stop_codon:yes gene_type:complete